jgi:hypothetical protein
MTDAIRDVEARLRLIDYSVDDLATKARLDEDLADAMDRLARSERAMYEFAITAGQKRAISRRANRDEAEAARYKATAALWRAALKERTR